LDSSGWIGVGPPDRAGVAAVTSDVPHEFSAQVRRRGEDAASDDVPLDFAKPDFALVEPRGIGRGEMAEAGDYPYGIAIPKKVRRNQGANPVWSIDITPKHHWLTNPINDLVAAAITSGNFESSEVARLAPFFEQMGTVERAIGTPTSSTRETCGAEDMTK
jgi:hypothetical protein